MLAPGSTSQLVRAAACLDPPSGTHAAMSEPRPWGGPCTHAPGVARGFVHLHNPLAQATTQQTSLTSLVRRLVVRCQDATWLEQALTQPACELARGSCGSFF